MDVTAHGIIDIANYAERAALFSPMLANLRRMAESYRSIRPSVAVVVQLSATMELFQSVILDLLRIRVSVQDQMELFKSVLVALLTIPPLATPGLSPALFLGLRRTIRSIFSVSPRTLHSHFILTVTPVAHKCDRRHIQHDDFLGGIVC